MRLLTYVASRSEQARLIGLLQSQGIPVLGDQMPGIRYSMQTALFVCIDEQYDDALALLKNPEHTVSEPVDVDAFWKASAGTQPQLLRWSLVALAVLVGVCILVVAIRLVAR